MQKAQKYEGSYYTGHIDRELQNLLNLVQQENFAQAFAAAAHSDIASHGMSGDRNMSLTPYELADAVAKAIIKSSRDSHYNAPYEGF